MQDAYLPSPDVFWWRDGTWTQLPELQPDGDVVALPSPDLVRLIQQIFRQQAGRRGRLSRAGDRGAGGPR